MSITTAKTDYIPSFGISADSLANIASTSTATSTVYRITLPAEMIKYDDCCDKVYNLLKIRTFDGKVMNYATVAALKMQTIYDFTFEDKETKEVFRQRGLVVGICDKTETDNTERKLIRSKELYELNLIHDVYFNEEKGTTTVKWKDGTITTVFCDEDDTYDKEKGLAMCVMKYYFGNDGHFNKVIKTFVPEVEYAVKTEKGYKLYNYRNAKVAATKLNKTVNYILNRCEEDMEMNFIYDV